MSHLLREVDEVPVVEAAAAAAPGPPVADLALYKSV